MMLDGDDDALLAAIIASSNRLTGRGNSLRKPLERAVQDRLDRATSSSLPENRQLDAALVGRGVSAEAEYAKVAAANHRKSFGQYFTPPALASLMADWIAQNEPGTVLDPAFGTGALVKACLDRLPAARVAAFEVDPEILKFAHVASDERVRVANSDFLKTPLEERFDAVIMNPPYIRHREFEGYDDVRAMLSVKSGFVIPRSSNLYIYFAVKAVLQLRPGGRASVLIPTEWMNANFSATFKRFLLQDSLLKEVVLFSGCSNIFEDALTTASILFLERSK